MDLPKESKLAILSLPTEILEKIFGSLNFDNISKTRLVCKRFDEICSLQLNSAFQRLQNLMQQRFQKIKAQMPRRESARRKHPLARESDIIETLHMRLSLLQMAFGKHIERKHCCFFAGEILDEVYRILNYVQTTPNPARAYKVTDELFDLSTMAMEYFKEHIEPTLPEITYFGSDFLDFNSFSTSQSESNSWKLLNSHGSSRSASSSIQSGSPREGAVSAMQSGTTIRKRLHRFRQEMKRYDRRQTSMWRDQRRCRARLSDQEKQIKELGSRMEDCNKKAEESSRKFNSILQELNKCKTELQYWRSKSPANQICRLCEKTVGEEARLGADGIDNASSEMHCNEEMENISKQQVHHEFHVESMQFIPILNQTEHAMEFDTASDYCNSGKHELDIQPSSPAILESEPQPSCSSLVSPPNQIATRRRKSLPSCTLTSATQVTTRRQLRKRNLVNDEKIGFTNEGSKFNSIKNRKRSKVATC